MLLIVRQYYNVDPQSYWRRPSSNPGNENLKYHLYQYTIYHSNDVIMV